MYGFGVSLDRYKREHTFPLDVFNCDVQDTFLVVYQFILLMKIVMVPLSLSINLYLSVVFCLMFDRGRKKNNYRWMSVGVF